MNDMVLLLAPGSMIQSTFISGESQTQNFEAVLYVPEHGQLQHYYRQNDQPDRFWRRAQIVNSSEFPVIGPGALCQSNFGTKGNFELVVPEATGLVHYWHDNDQIESKWRRTNTIALGSQGAGAILQNRRSNDLEVVVCHGRNLIHYWRNDGNWQMTTQPVMTNASGPAALIQSSYGDNLELIVQDGERLVLYFREWDAAGKPWKFGGVIAERATGAPGFIQGNFGLAPQMNFEVVFPVDDHLELYWRDNTPSGRMIWKSGGVITHGTGNINAVSMIRGSMKDQHTLNLITQECWESVFQYYRYQETNGEFVWMRNGCLRIHEGKPGQRYPDPMTIPSQSFKINQVTGSWDAQIKKPTLSVNPDARIRGTDLGASFEHNGKLYFLFGDTHWQGNSLPGTADSLAYTSDTDPWGGINLHFHKSYLCVRFPDREVEFYADVHGIYDVPQDGFSFRGQIFSFFSTDHFKDGKVMGRSVLARCDEEPNIEESDANHRITFQYLTEFSRYRFINVSVQYANIVNSSNWGLPNGREGLLIWGTGAYRADHIYLAFMPLDNEQILSKLLSPFNVNPIDLGNLNILYYCGLDNGNPQWSLHEKDAMPLFYPAAIGELSVRWDATLSAFVMMYMSGPDDPIGPCVVIRLSHKPWGPWSDRRMAFNWYLDGLGYRDDKHSKPGNWFIHVADLNDGLGDNIINNRGPNEGGAAYAPYQIPRYTRLEGNTFHIFYLLSTWNPYQAVLMRHAISKWDCFALLGDWYVKKLTSSTLTALGKLKWD